MPTTCRLSGHVYRPGTNQYRSGLRLTDVIPSIDDLKPNADLHYVLIRREQVGTRRIQAFSADLEQAWRSPLSDANPRLAARDQVIVFDLETGRGQYLAPIIEELRLQSSSGEPSRVVSVTGQVRAPGDYPLEPGMTISDLVRAGGGLDERALDGSAELARYEVVGGQSRRTDVLPVNLGAVLAGDVAADLPLRPFDTLVIQEISEWSDQEFVRLEGEVRFPGEYPIARGETLRSVVARAGGLTPLAFPHGSVFTRELLKERERQQMKVLAGRLRQDLSSLALQGAQAGAAGGARASETLAIGQSLLTDLETMQPVGRLVIDLERVLAAAPGSARGSHAAQRRPAADPEARAGSDRDRRGAEPDLAPVRSRAVARRLPGLERRHEPEGRRQSHLRGARQRQRGDRRRQPLVPGGGRHPARRHDRRAARCRAHQAADAVDGGDDDHLQHRGRRGRGEFVLNMVTPARIPEGGYPIEPQAAGELTFTELAAWLRRHLFGMVGGAALGLMLGLLASSAMPRVYRSQAVLAPNLETMQSGGLADLAGQLGGLAALAGVRVPGGSNKDEAIELLKSRGFAARYITEKELLPRLFEKDWDATRGDWAVAADDVPSVNQGVDRFVMRVRRVQEDRGTGMVTLTIDWIDREEAARWADEMVSRVNEELRARAVTDADRSLAFLQEQVEQTTVLPVKEAMFKLIEGQMKTIMLANVRTEYAFRIIDPPVVADADDYISPNWALNCLLGAFFGAACGVGVSMLLRQRRSARSKTAAA